MYLKENQKKIIMYKCTKNDRLINVSIRLKLFNKMNVL